MLDSLLKGMLDAQTAGEVRLVIIISSCKFKKKSQIQIEPIHTRIPTEQGGGGGGETYETS